MMLILSSVFLIVGTLLLLIAGLGIVRMPDLFLRMSASTKATTLGTGCILVAAMLHFGETAIVLRAFLIIAFIFLTAPVSAHMIARATYRGGVKLYKMRFDELHGVYDIPTHKSIPNENTPKP